MCEIRIIGIISSQTEVPGIEQECWNIYAFFASVFAVVLVGGSGSCLSRQGNVCPAGLCRGCSQKEQLPLESLDSPDLD